MKKTAKLIALLLIFTIVSACAPESMVTPPKKDVVESEKKTEVTTPPEASAEEAKAKEAVKMASALVDGYFYDEAKALLNDVSGAVVDEKKAEIERLSADIVKYEGQPYHVFFHSLILYPELAFDNKGHSAQGYNMWMTTRTEFERMLPLLLENNFVLYDIENTITRNADGTIAKRDIYIPKGKKPLIISQDDVCYYDYMQTDGFAKRMLVNAMGEVVTEVVEPAGTTKETHDGDVVPILDAFVKEHPEFSYRGAKGILAVTGYQGAFGYRITDLEGAELEAARAEVVKLTKALNATGWKIANHSYTHNGYFRDGTITMEQMTRDTTKWKTRIAPYVGDPKIYISPFGVHFKPTDPRYRYLVEQGYDIYCPVARQNSTAYYKDNMMQNRYNLDGFAMFGKPDFIGEHYFDVSKVIDAARPKPDWLK